MILYIIFAEISFKKIRQNNGIKGIAIGEKELKLLFLSVMQQYI